MLRFLNKNKRENKFIRYAGKFFFDYGKYMWYIFAPIISTPKPEILRESSFTLAAKSFDYGKYMWHIFASIIFIQKKLENLRESFFLKHMFYGGSNSASTVQPLVRSTPETLFSALQYTSIHHKASTIYCLALQRSKQFQINNAKKGFFRLKQ